MLKCLINASLLLFFLLINFLRSIIFNNIEILSIYLICLSLIWWRLLDFDSRLRLLILTLLTLKTINMHLQNVCLIQELHIQSFELLQEHWLCALLGVHTFGKFLEYFISELLNILNLVIGGCLIIDNLAAIKDKIVY